MNRAFRTLCPAITTILCLLCLSTLCGCATTYNMALDSKPKALDLETKSLGLFTLRTSNQYKPSYEPDVKRITVIPEGGKEVHFLVTRPHRQKDRDFLEYLVSIDLAPGTYTIGNISGISQHVIIYGKFEFPADMTFELPANAVVYLGHIDMINRKRSSDEKRSGSVLPLIDQAASGYADGTFDITITDKSGEDIPLFEKTYPILNNHIIDSSIMKK